MVLAAEIMLRNKNIQYGLEMLRPQIFFFAIHFVILSPEFSSKAVG